MNDSGLRLHLENYRAIASADVTLSDLTVLAGVNGSGKSTIARFFHRLVCIESQLPRHAANLAYSHLYRNLSHLTFLLPDGFGNAKSKIPQNLPEKNFLDAVSRLEKKLIDYLQQEDVQKRTGDRRFAVALDRQLSSNDEKGEQKIQGVDGVLKWLKDQFHICRIEFIRLVNRESSSSELFFNTFFNGESLGALVDKSSEYIEYNGGLFNDLLKSKQSVLEFSDDDATVVSNKDPSIPFSPIYSPLQSFYIARPAVDFPTVTSSKLKLNGVEYVFRGQRRFPERYAKHPLGIDSLMGGSVSAPQEKYYVSSADWLFSSKCGDTFALQDCADGIKSLATVSLLDNYGLLNEGSLLIIDEPEVHLHPQWVVGMAHILVRLAKYRKVRVLITTHSPDMVHALRDFAENENFGDQTNFYLSSKDEKNGFGFRFKSLGRDIGPIFAVFNRAKESIAEISTAIRNGETP